MRTRTVAAALAAAALFPAGAQAAPGPSCTTTADAEAAARALYGAGTELAETRTVAGLSTALALEPRIHPGTRRAMVRTADGWCDAADGFNRAWTGAADGAATAAAYARLAAAPYFDGVTVREVRSVPGGVHVVRTHARTNGVEARWVVRTDAAGVRSATWTATRFAVRPLEASMEGLTALPGATETYTRLASGLLRAERGLPTAASARAANRLEPSVPAVYTAPDGFQIRLSIGDTHVGIDPGQRTGVRQADVLHDTMEALRINYGEFHDWGLRKGWESDLDPALPDTGWMYINDALSLYCLACVFIADDFQIHMISEVTTALAALGFDGYPDDRKAYINVVGHEMFHNFQNAYNNPGPLGRSRGRGVSTAYSEGTARFQETLHSYADVSFAPRTLVTGGQTNPPGLSLDGNHCNGYGTNEAAFAAGPFPKTYNACYFWTSWYTQNGHDAFVRLVTEGFPAHATKGNEAEGVAAMGTAAPGVAVADQLAWFARTALTGHDLAFAPASGELGAMDWGSRFFRWQVPALDRGQSASRSLGGGGVLGRRVTGPARVALEGEGLALLEVRAAADGTSTALPLDAAGADVAAPAAGEKVWVVAANPTGGAVPATLSAS
jgi:hypothetical protein